ncbi:unnamed protein product [Schistosoma margrebowiei]|uniref:Uncharacterized protein n=1 Tax=Schistosoma margrebowiei TaxID=48269 RepID=A0A183LE27_9TREM|nr:unnamed protein product [Schistosoma margrebowiei]
MSQSKLDNHEKTGGRVVQFRGVVARSSQQKTVDLGFVLFGTHQQDVPVILRELVLHDRFDAVSLSFTVRDFTIGLSGSRPI